MHPEFLSFGCTEMSRPACIFTSSIIRNQNVAKVSPALSAGAPFPLSCLTNWAFWTWAFCCGWTGIVSAAGTLWNWR